MLKKLMIGAAVALSALPVLAQSGSDMSAGRVRRVGGADSSVWSEDSQSASPEWQSAVSSDSQAAANARLAQKLRMSRQSAVKPASHMTMQDEPIADAASCGTGCSSGVCSSSCDSCSGCGSCNCCCDQFWHHRCGVFGEYIYWNSTGTDVAYGAQANTDGGPIATPGNITLGNVPMGQVGVVDLDANSSYRAGFTLAFSDCASATVTYTHFNDSSTDVLGAPGVAPGDTTVSFVQHPGTDAFSNPASLILDNYLDLELQTLDVDFARLATGSNNHYINYSVGVRWGNLEQNFSQFGDFAPPTGTLNTFTNIDFDGVGLRLGVDGRRRMGCGGWSVYGKGFFTAMFGQFRSQYTQFNVDTDTIEATANWDNDRVVPVLEYEVGVSWSSRCDRLRLSAGYYTAFWFDTVTSDEWIRAVQNSNYTNVGETIAFDGLTARVEYRF